MAVNGVEIKVGQVWRTRGGDTVSVRNEYSATIYPFRLDNGETVTKEGRYYNPYEESELDLVELVSEAPEIDTKAPEPPIQFALPEVQQGVTDHPLYPVFIAAIEQAMYGKGERHGGAVTPFLEQPWVHYVNMHGRGFATGQAAKKLEEAASTRDGTAFETEVLGAIVYAGMAVLKERGAV